MAVYVKEKMLRNLFNGLGYFADDWTLDKLESCIGREKFDRLVTKAKSGVKGKNLKLLTELKAIMVKGKEVKVKSEDGKRVRRKESSKHIIYNLWKERVKGNPKYKAEEWAHEFVRKVKDKVKPETVRVWLSCWKHGKDIPCKIAN